FARRAIDNRDGSGIGQVHEDAFRSGVELETFWMRPECNVSGFASPDRIDLGQCAPAIPHKDATGTGLNADIVCIIAKIDAAGRAVIFAFEQADRSIARVGHVQGIGRRLVPTPWGSLSPTILLTTLLSLKSTILTLLLPSSATNSRWRSKSIVM